MIDAGNNHHHVSGAVDEAVSPRPGVLHSVTINTPIANATIELTNGNGGAVLASITLPADVSAMPPSTLHYGVAYSAGLHVVTTGASLDVTVTWR